MAAGEYKKLRLEYPLLEQIDISDSNVRKSDRDRGIEELADSIREIGLQHPVVVCKKTDGRYDLISGQRRYYACKTLGWTRIPAIVRTVRDQTQAVIISFSENIHRLDIAYRNKMQAATVLLARLGNIRDVAKRIGVSEQTVVNYLGYAAVPDEVKKMVDEGKIGATTALEITRKNYPDTGRIIEIARKVRELPRAETRGYFIEAAAEDKNRPVEDVFRTAKKQSLMKSITIHVTEKIYTAVVEAEQKYERSKEDIIRELVETWLENEGLV